MNYLKPKILSKTKSVNFSSYQPGPKNNFGCGFAEGVLLFHCISWF